MNESHMTVDEMMWMRAAADRDKRRRAVRRLYRSRFAEHVMKDLSVGQIVGGFLLAIAAFAFFIVVMTGVGNCCVLP